MVEKKSHVENIEWEYMKKGEDNFFKKRFLTSEIYFLKVIEINPENSIAHSYLGEIYLLNKKYEKAIHHFKLASELAVSPKNYKNDPSNPILFFNSRNTNEILIPLKEYFRLSQTYFLLNNYEQSEHYCKKIIDVYPDFFQCYYYLGVIQSKFYKDREKTIKYLNLYHQGLVKFLEQNQTPDPISKQELKKIEEVLHILTNPEIENHSLSSSLDPLHLFYKKKNTSNIQNEIQEKINKTINQSPTLTLPTEKYFDPIWIEILYNKNYDKNKSLQLLQNYKQSKEIKSAKEQYYIRKTLCDMYFELQQFEDAEKECMDALNFDFEPEILYKLSLISKQLNKKNDFYKYIYKYLDYKNDINALFLLAHELYHEQRLKESLVYIEKILQLQVDHKESLVYKIKISKELGQIDEMRNTVKKVALFHPEDYDLHRYMIFELLELEDYDLSKELLSRIYKKTKSLNEGLILTGILLNQNEEQKAFEILGELYQIYPDNYDLVKTIIITLKKLNRNFDSIENIVKNFLSISKDEEEKKKILEILPEEIKVRIQNYIDSNEDSIKNTY